MCGRLVLTTPAHALAKEFAAATGGLIVRSRWNIAPMTDVVVLRADPEHPGERRLSMLRWGLIPFWARDPSIAAKLINARSETVAEKRSFREAVRKRRCIVPSDGFYEWKRAGSRKQAWYFCPSDASRTAESGTVGRVTLAMAGLWEIWSGPDGEPVETCCLLTTAANAVMAPVHDRMPVLLDDNGIRRWLDPSMHDAKALAGLLHPAPDSALKAWPVSSTVNAVRNDDPRNVEPVVLDADEEQALPPAQGSLF
jgi:putative SOS response-associated peptidase YedK